VASAISADGDHHSVVLFSVDANLSSVEPGRRWAHSPSPSKDPGISYQGTMKTFVKMLKPQEVSNCYMVLLSVSSGTSVGRLRVSSFFEPNTGSPVSCKELSSCGRVPTRGSSSECFFFHSSPSSVIR